MIEKIKAIIEWSKMSPSGFCNTLGIQRSALTHILNGRNKPSLVLIEKILRKFPEISPDWLLLDKGPMLRKETTSQTLFNNQTNIRNDEIHELNDLHKTIKTDHVEKTKRIILIYDDDTFLELVPKDR